MKYTLIILALCLIGCSVSIEKLPTVTMTSTPPPTKTVVITSTIETVPSPTMSDHEKYYATRNWATETTSPTPYPITLPCDPEFLVVVPDGEEYLDILAERLILWQGWIELYRQHNYHDLPVEIPLAVIMHESRGSNTARGLSCEVGLFQIIPGDAAAHCPQYPENPKTAQLAQSSKNIYHGIGRLEEYSWEGHYYISGEDVIHRFVRYEAYPLSSRIKWWYSSEGFATLAMFQCGPTGLADGICNERVGGYVYAENVLMCWVPWIEEVLDLPVYIDEVGTAIPSP